MDSEPDESVDVAAAAPGRPVLVPPVLYLPVEVDESGAVRDVRMIKLGDGRVALCAYTALDRFVACWGAGQAWALVNTADLPGIHDQKPFDVKLLDVLVPEPVRSSRPEPVSSQSPAQPGAGQEGGPT